MVKSLLTDVNRIWVYSTLLRIRPAQLSDLLKKCFRVRRQYIQTRTGHAFWTDPVSIFGLQLLHQGIYEPQMTRLLELVLRPSDTFIDVGGNEGYFSIIASSLVSNGKVHCIEPQTRLESIIRENIRINYADRVIIHRVALSDKEGRIELFLRPSTNTGGSGMFRYWKIGSAKEDVHALTLDSFFKENSLERVRLLKVDCEGAEYLVITGGRSILKQRAIDFIALEYHPVICGIEKCIYTHEELKSAGYILTRARGQCIYHLPGLEKELGCLGELNVGCDWNE